MPVLGGSRRNTAMTFGIEKLDGEKNYEDMFIRFDRIHERDRRTDRHCNFARQHRPHLHR